MEQLKNLNYMYLLYVALAITAIFIIYMLYVSLNKQNCQSCNIEGPVNAPVEIQKSMEGFENREENEDKIKGEIVLYYAMWCGYSRAFLPEFEKFENYAKENLPHVRVIKMRCEGGHEQTCSQKGVDGFPMVILYVKNGPEKVFDKERTMQKLVEFVNENL